MNLLFVLMRMRKARLDELAAALGWRKESVFADELINEGFIRAWSSRDKEHRDAWGKRRGPKVEGYEIQRKGLTHAREHWGLRPGLMPPRERRRVSEEHRHISRMWPSIVRWNWRDKARVFAGWSEPWVTHTKARPDALVWGLWEGQETLFWLEVEMGHRRLETFMERLRVKLEACAALDPLPVILAILSKRWVIRAISLRGLLKPAANVAIVVGRDNGKGRWRLPLPRFGGVEIDGL